MASCRTIHNINFENAEESICYWLFPSDENGHRISSKEELECLCSKYMAHIQHLTHDYIWYNEPFSLQVKLSAFDDLSETLGPHLSGRMTVGDYLEDEWFVFFLLNYLTKSFQNLVCRVIDGDGEFPLIEAALHLPSWVDPETAAQRVYLKNGLLHLIPLSVYPLCSGTPSVMDAVSLLNAKPSDTVANPAVQNSIKFRIEEYPRKISKEHHTTHAYVPVAVAALLNEYPTLISSAVRTFCNRDDRDNKYLRVMRHFPPETRVLTSVRFSKALYALLAAHSYKPDPSTGWNLPTKDNNAHIVGMKLACGFEILVCSAGGLTGATSTEDVDNAPWLKHKQSLSSNGSFRGELEGSKLQGDSEAKARQQFFSSNGSMEGSSEDLSAGKVVMKLLQKVNADFETYKMKEKDLVPPEDEHWLEVTPDSLEELLQCKFKQRSEIYPKESTKQDIDNSLNAFLQHSSTYGGAEIPPELLPAKAQKSEEMKVGTHCKGVRKASCNGRKQSGLLNLHPQHRKLSQYSNASDSSEMSSFSAKIDFHADSFSDALNNVLEFSLPEDEYFHSGDEDSSGMSSYDEEEKELYLSRKTSVESSASKDSSGVDADLNKELEARVPPHRKKSSKGISKKRIPLAHLDDEFDIEDNLNDPIHIDMKVVSELLNSYVEEGGIGPASSLLSALKLQPPSSS